MRALIRLRPAVALVAALALAVPGPVAGAQSLEDARRERAAVQQRLDQAAAELADLQAREGALADEATELESRRDALEAQAVAAEERVGTRVRDLYKRGADVPVLHLLGADDATVALERAELASRVLTGDRIEIETALAARDQVTTVADELALRQGELADVRAAQDAALDALQADLEQARALEERLEEEDRLRREAEARRREQERLAREAAEAARQREAQAAQEAAQADEPAAPAPAAPSTGGRACPVGQPHSFTDTWGAARSGGRRHQGVDILAPYGTPVYAVVSGVWDVRSYGNLAGNWAILRGNDGHTYYYMHLQSHTVGDGAAVSAGTQTGTVGDTGNARGTPHLHFEYHPGGGGAVNPYPVARDAC